MTAGFEKWWSEQGRFMDPDTEDVHWYDKREALARLAFDEGVKIGMAIAGNYVADDYIYPTCVRFANGRTVTLLKDPIPHLEISSTEVNQWA